MSDQIPQIKVPFKAPEQKLIPYAFANSKADSFYLSVFGGLPWLQKPEDNKLNEKEKQIKQKVQEIQGKLKPDLPKLSDVFVEKVVILAEELKCSPEDLLAIMYKESGGWDPSIVAKDKNGEILYGGLIQMNKTSLKVVADKYADKLNLKENISMNEYLKLSREKQIDYAKGYFTLLKTACNLDNKKHLTAGETWGMLKSPRLTKARNQRFLNKLDNYVERIKKEIFIQEGQHLNVKN